MRRIEVRPLDCDLRPVGGRVLMGHYMRALTAQWAKLDGAPPVRGGDRNFRSLQVERLHGQSFVTRRQAQDEIIAWLRWCNQIRMHSTLASVSPVRLEQDWLAAQAKLVNL